jgi:SAM-dependent methyltransferase
MTTAINKMRRGVSRSAANLYYSLTSRFGSDELVFLNLGYEEDPPMELPLTASDEPNRIFIQMYYAAAIQSGGLEGKRVLEVSCGHGGGASYLMRTQHPESYTGLDLNRQGIEYCRRRHQLPGVNFVQGSAENLPFPDHSFDAVINIEAADHYPRYAEFLQEVSRVLRPGGHFLYTDLRARDDVEAWEADIANCPMTVVSQRVINREVARGLEINTPRLQKLNARFVPGPLSNLTFSKVCQNLLDEDSSYRMYCMQA